MSLRCMVEWGYSSTFLDLVLDGGGQLHTLAAKSPKKEPQHPLDRKMDAPEGHSGHCK
jgi:hypothetical protein